MPIDTYEQTVLDKRRQISIYTPASYESSAKRYPVLYMHDGQNVFDDDRALYGRSWRAAEAAERADVIIVAVDCNTEGTGRLDEYSVWELQADVKQKLALDPSRSAGGRGKAYIRYLMEELKPEMDRKWRTDPDRTGMAGSSAGGNCTLSAVCLYPHLIQYAAALSPACWLFQEKLEQQIKDAALAPQHRIYIDTGTDEHVGSVGPKAYMESVFTTAKVLQQTKADTRFHVQENGTHEEASWGERFSEAVMYLFEGGSR